MLTAAGYEPTAPGNGRRFRLACKQDLKTRSLDTIESDKSPRSPNLSSIFLILYGINAGDGLTLKEGRDGESAGARTQDQRLKRAMLYQLSYALINSKLAHSVL